MKIVTAQEMFRVEHLAYQEGWKEEDFMNRAGLGVAEAVRRAIGKYHLKPNIILLCGHGNNAGDAYVAGTQLLLGGFLVKALSLSPFEKFSPLCKLQSMRFIAAGGEIEYVTDATAISFGQSTIIIDGILGTGFKGEVTGLFREAIEKANRSKLTIIAVDIPSGINGTTGEIGGAAIAATETVFLGLPKRGCFIGQAWNHTGKISVYNFGLIDKFIEEAQSQWHLIEENEIKKALPKLERTRHKYQAGVVVGIGGSPGMPGAPILSSEAALRMGAGMMKLLHPIGMESELSSAPAELIRISYDPQDKADLIEKTKKADALFIGPGIGTKEETADLLKSILPLIDKPLVIDAEALTLIAKEKIPLPKKAVLTPHHGEMKRLLNLEGELAFLDFLQKVQDFVDQNDVTLVLKGSPTFILHPKSIAYVCDRGDPGMATAGSGDVLTGMIAALLAQKKTPLESAILGVYIHAVAGEKAALKYTSYSMVASDISHMIAEVLKNLI